MAVTRSKQESQIITVRSEQGEYQHLLKPPASLVHFFQQSPLAKFNVKLERVLAANCARDIASCD